MRIFIEAPGRDSGKSDIAYEANYQTNLAIPAAQKIVRHGQLNGWFLWRNSGVSMLKGQTTEHKAARHVQAAG